MKADLVSDTPIADYVAIAFVIVTLFSSDRFLFGVQILGYLVIVALVWAHYAADGFGGTSGRAQSLAQVLGTALPLMIVLELLAPFRSNQDYFSYR